MRNASLARFYATVIPAGWPTAPTFRVEADSVDAINTEAVRELARGAIQIDVIERKGARYIQVNQYKAA